MAYSAVGLAIFVLLYVLLSFFNIDEVKHPPPMPGVYMFNSSDTTSLLIEGRKEVERMLLAASALRERGNQSRALAHYGLAFKEGDEEAESIVDFVISRHGKALVDTEHALFTPQPNSIPAEGVEEPRKFVPMHVIMAADNGTYYGTHELLYVHAAMRYSAPIEVDGCVEARFGFLERPTRSSLTTTIRSGTKNTKTPVLAVVSGTAVTDAGRCAAAIMQLSGFVVQSVTFIGAAAVSPMEGGGGWTLPTQGGAGDGVTAESEDAATNPMCQRGWKLRGKKVSLGSVCVTYAAHLQECGICLEDTHRPSLCGQPQCRLHNLTSLSGLCNIRHSIVAMAETMKGSMYGKSLPPVPEAVLMGMRTFWKANEALPEYGQVRVSDGAGGEVDSDWFEYLREAPTAPSLLNCAESSMGQVLYGPRQDTACRTQAHTLLEGLYPSDNLTCVQAHEGVGLLTMMERQHPHVPVTIVRGAARYNMYPLRKVTYRTPTQPRLLTKAGWIASWQKGKERQGKEAEADDVPSPPPGVDRCGVSAGVSAGACAGEPGVPLSPSMARDMMESLLTTAPDAAEVAKMGTAGPHAFAQQPSEKSPSVFVRWEQKEEFMDAAGYQGFVKESHRYALETASAVVLNYFLSSTRTFDGDI